MKTPVVLITLWIALGSSASARFYDPWPIEGLTAQADLIVIAAPLHSVSTGVLRVFPGIYLQTKDNPLRGSVEQTTFQILATFKGLHTGSEVVVEHLRADPDLDSYTRMVAMDFNGPSLLSLEEGTGQPYILFLKREGDHFVPLSGFVDPDLSILKIDDGSPDIPNPEFPTVNFHPNDPFKP